jgi:hypothetical protein
MGGCLSITSYFQSTFPNKSLTIFRIIKVPMLLIFYIIKLKMSKILLPIYTNIMNQYNPERLSY